MSENPTPQPDWNRLTTQADGLLHELFPICRSITGPGLRATLERLRALTPFDVQEVPSGTVCYDWTVPEEWSVREAYIADSRGRRLVDFQASNLHLVNYSVPFEGELPFAELAPHLHTLPELPDAIPYRTTYYTPSWGFCLSHRQYEQLDQQATYRVRVDSHLAPGSLTYGEACLAGTSGFEYLLTTYVCHPSLANDNLSGVVLWSLLLGELQRLAAVGGLRNSYRFVIAPETIGALAFIARNEAAVRALAGGFVITTVAGPGPFGYKCSWRGDAAIDRAARQTFRELELDHVEFPFDVNGSDERQYSTPGLRVPMGTICKDKYYEYPFYHTSLDNLDYISAGSLVETLKLYWLAIEKLEQDRVYRSTNPIGEPMLGKRGLYPKTGGAIRQKAVTATEHARRDYSVGKGKILHGSELDAIRWLLFYADGGTSLLEVAEKTGFPMDQLSQVARTLTDHGLLELVK